MKRYKLLKDLPTFKAGDEFFISKMGNLIAGTPEKPKTVLIGDNDDFSPPTEVDLMAYAKETIEQFPNILTDWFEEVKEPKIIYSIDIFGFRVLEIEIDNYLEEPIENLKSLGLLFHTEEEAEKHLEYLKAKEIIKQDAKGFKPNWDDNYETKYHGYWDFLEEKPDYGYCHTGKRVEIHFKSTADIFKSFKKHPEEWKTYLTYEQ